MGVLKIFLVAHFKFIRKLENKTKHEIWACDYCAYELESRGNRAPEHIATVSDVPARKGCPLAPAKARTAAHVLMTSRKSGKEDGDEDEEAALTPDGSVVRDSDAEPPPKKNICESKKCTGYGSDITVRGSRSHTRRAKTLPDRYLTYAHRLKSQLNILPNFLQHTQNSQNFSCRPKARNSRDYQQTSDIYLPTTHLFLFFPDAPDGRLLEVVVPQMVAKFQLGNFPPLPTCQKNLERNHSEQAMARESLLFPDML
ncbi:hypothetical protein GGX14DRAFT_392745 [Mycena pura]|uniref:Uncharacterized protein n=1 Tax=Mycena pura TaxID=153505 RepID=A0AAD6VIN9_9AGAR|nr:hypothetical protein GGX14DRAFT_392745 [Mycena pura]